eukprot:2414748-Alexandrium_andersonii.AAC.1
MNTPRTHALPLSETILCKCVVSPAPHDRARNNWRHRETSRTLAQAPATNRARWQRARAYLLATA